MIDASVGTLSARRVSTRPERYAVGEGGGQYVQCGDRLVSLSTTAAYEIAEDIDGDQPFVVTPLRDLSFPRSVLGQQLRIGDTVRVSATTAGIVRSIEPNGPDYYLDLAGIDVRVVVAADGYILVLFRPAPG